MVHESETSVIKPLLPLDLIAFATRKSEQNMSYIISGPYGEVLQDSWPPLLVPPPPIENGQGEVNDGHDGTQCHCEVVQCPKMARDLSVLPKLLDQVDGQLLEQVLRMWNYFTTYYQDLEPQDNCRCFDFIIRLTWKILLSSEMTLNPKVPVEDVDWFRANLMSIRNTLVPKLTERKLLRSVDMVKMVARVCNPFTSQEFRVFVDNQASCDADLWIHWARKLWSAEGWVLLEERVNRFLQAGLVELGASCLQVLVYFGARDIVPGPESEVTAETRITRQRHISHIQLLLVLIHSKSAKRVVVRDHVMSIVSLDIIVSAIKTLFGDRCSHLNCCHSEDDGKGHHVCHESTNSSDEQPVHLLFPLQKIWKKGRLDSFPRILNGVLIATCIRYQLPDSDLVRDLFRYCCKTVGSVCVSQPRLPVHSTKSITEEFLIKLTEMELSQMISSPLYEIAEVLLEEWKFVDDGSDIDVSRKEVFLNLFLAVVIRALSVDTNRLERKKCANNPATPRHELEELVRQLSPRYGRLAQFFTENNLPGTAKQFHLTEFSLCPSESVFELICPIGPKVRSRYSRRKSAEKDVKSPGSPAEPVSHSMTMELDRVLALDPTNPLVTYDTTLIAKILTNKFADFSAVLESPRYKPFTVQGREWATEPEFRDLCSKYLQNNGAWQFSADLEYFPKIDETIKLSNDVFQKARDERRQIRHQENTQKKSLDPNCEIELDTDDDADEDYIDEAFLPEKAKKRYVRRKPGQKRVIVKRKGRPSTKKQVRGQGRGQVRKGILPRARSTIKPFKHENRARAVRKVLQRKAADEVLHIKPKFLRGSQFFQELGLYKVSVVSENSDTTEDADLLNINVRPNLYSIGDQTSELETFTRMRVGVKLSDFSQCYGAKTLPPSIENAQPKFTLSRFAKFSSKAKMVVSPSCRRRIGQAFADSMKYVETHPQDVKRRPRQIYDPPPTQWKDDKIPDSLFWKKLFMYEASKVNPFLPPEYQVWRIFDSSYEDVPGENSCDILSNSVCPHVIHPSSPAVSPMTMAMPSEQLPGPIVPLPPASPILPFSNMKKISPAKRNTRVRSKTLSGQSKPLISPEPVALVSAHLARQENKKRSWESLDPIDPQLPDSDVSVVYLKKKRSEATKIKREPVEESVDFKNQTEQVNSEIKPESFGVQSCVQNVVVKEMSNFNVMLKPWDRIKIAGQRNESPAVQKLKLKKIPQPFQLVLGKPTAAIIESNIAKKRSCKRRKSVTLDLAVQNQTVCESEVKKPKLRDAEVSSEVSKLKVEDACTVIEIPKVPVTVTQEDEPKPLSSDTVQQKQDADAPSSVHKFWSPPGSPDEVVKVTEDVERKLQILDNNVLKVSVRRIKEKKVRTSTPSVDNSPVSASPKSPPENINASSALPSTTNPEIQIPLDMPQLVIDQEELLELDHSEDYDSIVSETEVVLVTSACVPPSVDGSPVSASLTPPENINVTPGPANPSTTNSEIQILPLDVPLPQLIADQELLELDHFDDDVYIVSEAEPSTTNSSVIQSPPTATHEDQLNIQEPINKIDNIKDCSVPLVSLDSHYHCHASAKRYYREYLARQRKTENKTVSNCSGRVNSPGLLGDNGKSVIEVVASALMRPIVVPGGSNGNSTRVNQASGGLNVLGGESLHLHVNEDEISEEQFKNSFESDNGLEVKDPLMD